MQWKEKRKTEIGHLFDCIEKRFSFSKEQLISKTRKKEAVLARKYFMNIISECFQDGMTQFEIAELINRDRTTFIFSRDKHLNEYEQYKDYKQDYDAFKKDYMQNYIIL